MAGRDLAPFVGYDGIQTFRALNPSAQKYAAEVLAARLVEIAADGPERFIISNEEYFHSVEQLLPFFQRLAEKVDLRVLIWVRPVRSWLPSAAAQWGILHKQQPGPVQPLERQAEALIAWYAHLPRWTKTFGAAVTVRPFDRQSDVVAAASAMQLRKLSQPHLLTARDRLDLAVALDQPQTFHSTAAVTAEATARMQAREAELLSSTSWRVTAPLRAVSRIMRRGRR